MSSPFARSLPSRLDVSQQKKLAKELLRFFASGDVTTQARHGSYSRSIRSSASGSTRRCLPSTPRRLWPVQTISRWSTCFSTSAPIRTGVAIGGRADFIPSTLRREPPRKD